MRMAPAANSVDVRHEIPRFTMLGVVLCSIAFYFLLTVFIMLVVWLRGISIPLISEHAGGSQTYESLGISISSFFESTRKMPEHLRPIGGLLRFIALLCITAIFLTHVPLSRFFNRLRRGKPVPDALQKWSEIQAQISARTTAIFCFVAAACDSTVRRQLQISEPLGAEGWLQALKNVTLDIVAFEQANNCTLQEAAPAEFQGFGSGRIYDMALGPGGTRA